jgi:hypothetical protein
MAAFGGAATLAIPTPVQAALGAAYTSIAADSAQLHATRQITPYASYEVHELSLPSGTTVREFVSLSGIVFAIAWTGPSMPNLRQTLGSYFADYTAAAKASQGGRNHLALERSDLVIEAGGHMRAFMGRAYLTAAVPAGVARDALK